MDPEEQEKDNSEKLEEVEQKFQDQQKRAEKAENELKELKEALASASEGEEPEEKEDLPEQGSQFDAVADNLSVLKPLETDEIDELRKEAKELGVDPIKFAQSPAWKAHLDNMRNNKKAEDGTPAPSFRTAVYEGKSYKEVVQDPDASKETRQAAFEAQRDALLNRGNNKIM